MTTEIIKSIDQAVSDSVQVRATQPEQGRSPLLAILARAGELISPWWSQRRDSELDRFYKSSDHIAGAFYTLTSRLTSVPYRVEPRDPSIARHRRLAEEYQLNLESESEFGQGWGTLLTKLLMDLYSSDNGLFVEVIGGGNKDGPIRGLPVGLAHLDSHRCTRTGSVEYPVLYEDTDGRMYRLHRTRVLYRSQLPSSRADMYGVGFCWLSRCLNVAQSMVDVAVYKQEKLGSRQKRAIGITQGGLDPEDVASAMAMANATMDSRGIRRYSQVPFIGDRNIPDGDISLIDLVSLPDGFNYEDDVTLGMFTIALAGNVPARWLWPATMTGATKADAMFQHVAGLSGGPGATLKMIAEMLGGPATGTGGALSDVPRFLPAPLKMVFDFQDDEQDRMAAEIAKARAEARQKNLDSEVISIRTAREDMLTKGELTESQFEELELDSGRLPDGLDILTLFHTKDEQFVGLLAIDAQGDPLDVETNDPMIWAPAIDKQLRIVESVAVNAANGKLKKKARQVIVALNKLRDLIKSPGESVDIEPTVAPEESENVTQDQQPPQQPEPKQEEEDEEGGEKSLSPFDLIKTRADMLAGIRSAIRGYWAGDLSKFQFVDNMNSVLTRRLTQAWQEGAKECGIRPDELTGQEITALQGMISGQLSYVLGLANDIESGSKAEGGRLGPFLDRAQVWASQYQVARDRGRGMACADQKLEWVIDPANDNCGSCLKLAGKVKRASYWDQQGIYPQVNGASYLECKGYRCGCRLQPTDKPLSKGPLPGLP